MDIIGVFETFVSGSNPDETATLKGWLKNINYLVEQNIYL